MALDGGLEQSLTACMHELRTDVVCNGFGVHWSHSGEDETGEWIFWTTDRIILPISVDSGQ
jgi:hypothetical protein